MTYCLILQDSGAIILMETNDNFKTTFQSLIVPIPTSHVGTNHHNVGQMMLVIYDQFPLGEQGRFPGEFAISIVNFPELE